MREQKTSRWWAARLNTRGIPEILQVAIPRCHDEAAPEDDAFCVTGLRWFVEEASPNHWMTLTQTDLVWRKIPQLVLSVKFASACAANPDLSSP
jgi:hypothetical protein